MNKEMNNNNIYSYTFIGALLFIAACAFTLAYFSNIVMLEVSYTIISVLLTSSSIFLLYKATREDKNRLGGI